MNKSKSTKNKIFEASVYLFASKGFSGTSIRDIAKQVGIKESSIYNHYKGKSSLLDSILDYYIDGFKSALPDKAEMESTASEYTDPVKLWIRGTHDFLEKLPPLSDQISIIIHNEMFLNEKCQNFVLHNLFTAQKYATEILLNGLKSKNMIIKCNIKVKAEQYVYMLHGINIENRLLRIQGTADSEIQKNLFEQISSFIEELRI